MSETSEITNPLVKAINQIPRCWAVRIATGGYRGRIQLAPKGTVDIIGNVRGRMFAIECKIPGETPTTDQCLFLNAREYDGCIVGVATSVLEGLTIIGAIE